MQVKIGIGAFRKATIIPIIMIVLVLGACDLICGENNEEKTVERPAYPHTSIDSFPNRNIYDVKNKGGVYEINGPVTIDSDIVDYYGLYEDNNHNHSLDIAFSGPPTQLYPHPWNGRRMDLTVSDNSVLIYACPVFTVPSVDKTLMLCEYPPTVYSGEVKVYQFIYCDRPVRVSGKGPEFLIEGSEYEVDWDVSLGAGWNIVCLISDVRGTSQRLENVSHIESTAKWCVFN